MGSYIRPTSLPAALAALARRDRVIIAGGTDHFPPRIGPASEDPDLLDITALPGLRAIEHRDGEWWFPALATWTDIRLAALPPAFDGLRQAAGAVGGRQVQNAATLCGNLCNASPAADAVPNLLALDAAVELASWSGRRRLTVSEFILGNRRTARRPDEFMLGIAVPDPETSARSAFEKLGARRYLVISIVMAAAVAEFGPGGRIARARVAVGACSAVALRLPALEAALAGAMPDAALVQPAHLSPLSPIGDVRSSAEYRLAVALEIVRRAVTRLGEHRGAWAA